MAMTLITNSATTDSTDLSSIVFDSGIDSTYKLYIFKFIDINPATDGADWQFNGSVDAGSNYNVTKTTTAFKVYNAESGGTPAIAYDTTNDLAQSTAYKSLGMDIGNGADESLAGTLWLFNPSNTTYVKHFYSTVTYSQSTGVEDRYCGGYFNNADNIDAVSFKMNTGNFDGTIKMYGVG